MQEELKKVFHGLHSPYIYMWAIASPAITLLSPDDLIKTALFALLILASTIYWLIDRSKKTRKIRPDSSRAVFLTAIRSSVKNGVRYLEDAENKTEHDQRFRITLSAIDTATVIGAITVGKHFLNNSHINNEHGLAWLFEILKSQFSGISLPEKLAGFDCPKCRGVNDCNIAFFDYLSHFVYCRGTSLFESFNEHFSFLGSTLKDRLITVNNDMAGWSTKTGGSVIDPLATSTALHLCLIFNALNNVDIRRVVRCLISSQKQNGCWCRPAESTKYCGEEFKVISTHRAIETLRICSDISALDDMSMSISSAISKGARFLAGTPLIDAPVSYERQAGYASPEIYQMIGHVAQGLTKAGRLDSVVLKERISFLLNNQLSDGSFPTSSDVTMRNRNLLHYTDITAFMIRTLVFYANALVIEQDRLKTV